jgi:colanic acid biosynthesis glycosyl transferase WcaI
VGGRVLVVSELYWPEETSTGYLLTRIAEGMAETLPVSVLCAQPTYAARGTRAAARETRNGVDVRRVWGTALDKNVLPFRLLNAVTISLALFAATVRHLRRGDRVLVVTNPPFLPALVALACALRGARPVLLVHDVYPEAIVRSNLLGPSHPVVRVLGWLNDRLYRRMDRIVVLGRDMHARLARRLGGDERRLAIIPNWADLDLVAPAPREDNALLREHGLADRFVLQYCGNMGRTHNIEILLEAARRLQGSLPAALFLFIGSGARKPLVEAAARAEGNVRSLAPCPRHDLPVFLNACDVAVISFVPGMSGVSVPSRMYNVLASGKPIVAVADEDSELAQVVREADVGWVVPPDDVEALVQAVTEAHADPARRAAMGERARRYAVERCGLEPVVASYRTLMESLA